MKKICVVNCFQNCIFTSDSHPNWSKAKEHLVVNCFQNCIFTSDSHLGVGLQVRCQML